jgi:hypothetical protein
MEHAVVVHEEAGPKVGCGHLSSSASLSSTIGTYPGTATGVSGIVTVSVSMGLLEVSYTLHGLAPSETSGGLHIHSGTGVDVCSDASRPGGHHFDGAGGFTDPWSTTWAKTSGSTTASGTFLVGASGYDTLGENYLHAVVVHEEAGLRIGCGYLEFASTGVGAVGDPHLVNTLGQRFDLLQPGRHMLLLIPRGSRPRDALLRVDADTQHIGSACADTYIQGLNVTGRWTHESSMADGTARAGGFQYHAKDRHEGAISQRFGTVDLKVVWGHTGQGISYLNFFARHLGQSGYPVGGLLGEDDHGAAAAPVASCKHITTLVQIAERKDVDAYSGSTAEASLQ